MCLLARCVVAVLVSMLLLMVVGFGRVRDPVHIRRRCELPVEVRLLRVGQPAPSFVTVQNVVGDERVSEVDAGVCIHGARSVYAGHEEEVLVEEKEKSSVMCTHERRHASEDQK